MTTILTRERTPEQVEATKEGARRRDVVQMLCNAWYESVSYDIRLHDKAVKQIVNIVTVSAEKEYVTQREAELIAGRYILKCFAVESRDEEKSKIKHPRALVALVKDSSSLLYGRGGYVKGLEFANSMYNFQSTTLAEYGCNISARTIKSWDYDEYSKK